MITICSHKQHHNVAIILQQIKRNGSPSQVVQVATDQRQIYRRLSSFNICRVSTFALP